MTRVVMKIHTSIDGYVGTPSGDLDRVDVDSDDERRDWEVDLLSRAGVHAMGRELYLDMAAHWPTATDPYAEPMNRIPKVVFSRTLETAGWGPTTIARGDLAEELGRLDADLVLVHGGARLVRSLSRRGLIDEYLLVVHPVALGAGLPIFPGRQDLRLTSCRRFPGGSVLLSYEPIT
jgi:dihydrofolate reductase